MGGLTFPSLLKHRANAAAKGKSASSGKSVILLWMTGGPSQIDTWDPKPDRPLQNRGPFGTINTALPGVRICEHLPKQAAILDKITLIRSVDAKGSNHEPNMVMQTANTTAEPRVNPEARNYPAIASIVSKYHGSNHPAMPAYVTFAKSRSHIAFGGYLGKQYDPFPGEQATKLPIYTNVGVDTGKFSEANLFKLPNEVDISRVGDRTTLMKSFDTLRRDMDKSGNFDAMDRFSQQALEIVSGPRAREAFDISLEPKKYSRKVRQPPLEPAGATCAQACRGWRQLCYHRPQLPHRLWHLGQPWR